MKKLIYVTFGGNYYYYYIFGLSRDGNIYEEHIAKPIGHGRWFHQTSGKTGIKKQYTKIWIEL